LSTPAPRDTRPVAARLAGAAVVLAISCFCAFMWALLIRAHLPGPEPPGLRTDYADLLAPGEQERSARWGIYLGDQRIGSSQMQVARQADGTIVLTTKVAANLGPATKYVAGFVGVLDVEFRAVVSPLRGLLSWRAQSEALDANVQSVVREGRMLVKGRLAGRRVDSELPYEPGGLVSEAFSPLAAIPPLAESQVGRSWAVSVLNPVTGDLQDVSVRIKRTKALRIGESQVTAFELDFQGPGSQWGCWVTEEGEVLVQGTPFGLTLRREDLPAEALDALTNETAAPAEGPG